MKTSGKMKTRKTMSNDDPYLSPVNLWMFFIFSLLDFYSRNSQVLMKNFLCKPV